ncbi:MAG: hypothetical protein BECKG1743D_GA0114223_101208 [Candidatus Kentron sp. G]|nr:MAG: hypothetical protein BECKG1743F_GA0114225_101007 [Candidatus Kentron sp. G]VFM99407.1 MAG: hypothetical protein BECKG1743D_GA0114223_101208 [Candidatus Kentron sp. G]
MTITIQESTPESVWAFMQETARQMQETDRRMKETDRQMQETDRRIQETEQLLKETIRENDRRKQEADQRMRETDRQIQETSREIKAAKDLFTTQWGRLMESLVDGSLVKSFNRWGIAVEDTSTRVKGSHRGHSYEFDIIAHNGREIVIVEVKTTLRPDDVHAFLDKLGNVRIWMPRYRENIIHGAMAWLQTNAGAERMAANKGLFSIRAVGDSATITNEPDFQPTAF